MRREAIRIYKRSLELGETGVANGEGREKGLQWKQDSTMDKIGKFPFNDGKLSVPSKSVIKNGGGE